MTIRAVAWDVDGTLVDSEPLHHHALIAACGNWNVDISDIPEDSFRGVHMKDVWKALQPRMPASATWNEWDRANDDYYVRHRHVLKPMPLAIDTVKALDEAGITQICVSNAGRVILDANIDALGLADVMQFTLSLDDVAKGKPDPESYATGVARLKLRPDQTAAVEDSATGRRAARAAGLVVIAYDLGCGRLADADYVTNDLSRILSLLAAHRPEKKRGAGGA
ncbi:HAD family phosphatase [Nordella sp. HKS 07]|nr:HAD family phosphatase [Nordella sp. HKS 07]